MSKMQKPGPLRGPQGPMIVAPGQTSGRKLPIVGQAEDRWGDKPRIFRRGLIPEASQMPQERTSKIVSLIYNIMKGIVLLRDKAKQAAALSEIKEINPGMYDRVRTYYDRITPEQTAFFIGPRPKFLADGALAIYDHKRDNPLLQEVLKGEKPEDVKPGSLAPKSKLALPRRLGGVL